MVCSLNNEGRLLFKLKLKSYSFQPSTKTCSRCHKSQLRSGIRRTSNALTIGEMNLDEESGNSPCEILSRKTKLALSPSICTPRRMQTTAPRNKLSHQYRPLFKALNSEKDADTPMHPKGNNCRSDVEPVPRMDMITRRISHHILKFTQSNTNPTFSPSSFYETSFPCLDMITRRINHHILKFTQSNANPTFSPSSFYVR